MIEALYPKACVDSAYAIPYEQLYARGFRGIIFDIDNTLVPHGAAATPQAEELFARLRGIGYDTCLISNNKEDRVMPFADAVGSRAVWKANKPSVKNYWRACELMGTKKEQTLFVGDQLFTDVWGANRAGIASILVRPIHPKEEIQIVLKRYLERVVLFFYRRRKDRSKDLL